jgi:hypothetical protein
VATSLRSLQARMAAHAMHSKHDSRITSAPGRTAFLDRFERAVREEALDAGEVLSDAEIKRRAEHRKTAHMTKLSYLAAKSRARK